MSKTIDEMMGELNAWVVTARGLRKHVPKLEVELENFKTDLENYDNKIFRLRTTLVIAKLAEEGKNWCTWCFRLFPSTQLSIIMTTGLQVIEPIKDGIVAPGTFSHQFREDHRVCPNCRSEQLALNNTPFDGVRTIHGRHLVSLHTEVVGEEFLKYLYLPKLVPEPWGLEGNTLISMVDLIETFFKELFEIDPES